MTGNRSTGMRARLVTPITINARQITTMKYGLRMEKLDTAARYFSLSWPSIFDQLHDLGPDFLACF